MDPAEIRRIRGSRSRAAFGQLLGVTPLTVLRWELPEDNKEARRPRAKMVEAMRRLASVPPEAATGPASSPVASRPTAEPAEATDGAQTLDEARVRPLLAQLCTEQWRTAEDALTALLSSDALTTRVGRTLASLGLVQVQVLAHMDLRGALAVLVPILNDAGRGELPDDVAGRAHVMGTFVFAAPDSRVHDLGRVNVHAGRAERLLAADDDDLRIMCATSCVAAVRYLGPQVTLHAYGEHLKYLERARSPLSKMLADALAGLAATARGDVEASAQLGARALEAAEGMGHWGLVMGILSDYAHRTLRGSQTPDAVLAIAQRGRQRASAAQLVPTEGFVRLLAAECEALIRLGRLAHARECAAEALGLAQRMGLSKYCLTAVVARLALLTDRYELMQTLITEYESEASGPQRGAALVHGAYLHGVLSGLEGAFDVAAASLESVCAAPESTPGLEYILHDAHLERIVAKTFDGDLGGAEQALRRFDELLEQKESVWHALMARRTEALIHLRRGRISDARLRMDSTRATFELLGDAIQAGLQQLGGALLAATTEGGEAAERARVTTRSLAAMGACERYLERFSDAFAQPKQASLREQTMAERLVVASERLNVRGLDPMAFSAELTAVLGELFPQREALVGGEELAAVETTVGAGDGAAGLRFGVRGPLDGEQRAFLLLLAALIGRRPIALTASAPSELELDGVLPDFVAVAPATRKLKSEILRLSRSTATLLITGESGSGKEVVARAVHDTSQRAGKPYVTFNCASVPRDLFEGQLFGYKKGAFTGASADSPGVIRAAHGGTLFLDEIGELPLEMQPKLLRFLENREVLPLGDVTPKQVDVRIVAATHRDLDRLVQDGRFREDLYYRLNVVPIRIPPLRERKEDVTALARLFIKRSSEPESEVPSLSRSAAKALEDHDWPGNVRELRNVIERALAYTPVPAELHAEHLALA
jgi:hypothetical protein